MLWFLVIFVDYISFLYWSDTAFVVWPNFVNSCQFLSIPVNSYDPNSNSQTGTLTVKSTVVSEDKIYTFTVSSIQYPLSSKKIIDVSLDIYCKFGFLPPFYSNNFVISLLICNHVVWIYAYMLTCTFLEIWDFFSIWRHRKRNTSWLSRHVHMHSFGNRPRRIFFLVEKKRRLQQ
jgi:hypothetical protein